MRKKIECEGDFTVEFPAEVIKAGLKSHLSYFGQQLHARLDAEFPPAKRRSHMKRACSLKSFAPEKVVWLVEYVPRGNKALLYHSNTAGKRKGMTL